MKNPIAPLAASLAMLTSSSLSQPPKDAPKAAPKTEEHAPPAPDRASAETKAKFERFKKMAGAWQTGDENKDGKPGEQDTVFKIERIKDPAAAAKVIEAAGGTGGTATK